MSLTENQIARLARLQNRVTRYEMVAVHVEDPSKRFLVCYTPRKNLKGLQVAVGNRYVALCRTLGLDPHTTMVFFDRKPEPRAVIGDWTVKFSGRTQRDVIIADDEPTFIGV